MDGLALLQRPIEDPVLIFTVAMALILLAPILFRALRLPGIVGLIVAGAVLGPNALAILDQSETVRLLGTVGLLYVMFLAGLEIDMGQLRRARDQSLGFGILTFLIPQSLGTAVFLALGYSWGAAILIASMFASHTLVSYPVVARLGIARDEAVTAGVGGTVLTDTLALLVLAVVARSTAGHAGALFWLHLAGLFALYITLVIILLPRLGRWFFRHVREGGVPEFAFVLAAVFGCAFLAGAVGTEPIIGAFLAGLVLNRLIHEGTPLLARIRFFGDGFLIPFFLIYIGMFVDPRALATSPAAWIVTLAMVGTTVAAKGLAAWIAGAWFRYSSARRWLLFGLSVPQAAATLAVTLVGYDMGIFGEEVLNGAVVLIFATCVLGPWVTERWGRRLRTDRAGTGRGEEAEGEERVLVPLANPRTADALVGLALALRGDSHQPLFPLHVSRSGDPFRVREGEEMLSGALEHAAAVGALALPLTRVDLDVVAGIDRASVERRATTVVVGWNGKRSAADRIFGSVLDRVVEGVRPAVVVARVHHRPALSRLLVAAPPWIETDESLDRTLAQAKSLARSMSLELVVLGVGEHLPPLLRRLDHAAPSGLKAVPRRMASWVDLPQILRRECDAERDLLVLLAARRGRASWEGGLTFLPGNLAEWFPELSFLTMYPPLPDVHRAASESLHHLAEPRRTRGSGPPAAGGLGAPT